MAREHSLDNYTPGNLYDRIILGKTPENKVGLAYFPPDDLLLDGIQAFFSTAEKGDRQAHEIVSSFKRGKLKLLFDQTPLELAQLRNEALKYSHLTRDQLALVVQGFVSLLTGDPQPQEGSIEAAKEFTEALYNLTVPR
jgi:hypothetical protein